MDCNNGITIPTLQVDPCNGNKILTKCVIHDKAITYLEIPINSTSEEIIDKLVISLIDARNRILALENIVSNHELRIQTLEP